MQCSWANLVTNEGIQDLTVPASNNLDATWEIFETNDTSVFGTALNTDTSTQRNIQFDNVLKIKKSGICIVGFHARWANGNYARRSKLEASQDILNSASFAVKTPMMGWATTDHDVNEDYKAYNMVNSGDFIRFTLYNDSGSSKLVTFRSAYALWFPQTGSGPTEIF